MKLASTAKADAQALADRLHQWAIFNSHHYAESVALGWTLRWDFPKQVVNKDGGVTDAKWGVALDERVVGGLTLEERAEIPELAALGQEGKA